MCDFKGSNFSEYLLCERFLEFVWPRAMKLNFLTTLRPPVTGTVQKGSRRKAIVIVEVNRFKSNTRQNVASNSFKTVPCSVLVRTADQSRRFFSDDSLPELPHWGFPTRNSLLEILYWKFSSEDSAIGLVSPTNEKVKLLNLLQSICFQLTRRTSPLTIARK